MIIILLCTYGSIPPRETPRDGVRFQYDIVTAGALGWSQTATNSIREVRTLRP